VTRFDILIGGGGISGVSLAARLAGRASVAVLEAEEQLGAHATGRSAALLVEAYGPPVIRTLTKRSRSFFEAPPEGFAEAGLARRRGALIYGGEADVDELRREYELARKTTDVAWLEAEAVLGACPLLKPGIAVAGFLEPDALDLDTNALLHGFARTAQRAGARIVRGVRAERIESRGTGWRVSTAGETFDCGILVDAAGAWADDIAALAGAPRHRLQPMRRTAATIPVPPAIEALLPSAPFVAPVDNSFYFKPEAGAVMVSLCDATPSDPCDAWADDLDVALALERFHAATIVPEARPTATWAGLRTFAPDGDPVVGLDPAAAGFFWHAGQGGYGIQTSPALSALAAKLVLGDTLDAEEAALAAALSPARFDDAAAEGRGDGTRGPGC
jgi:D-arginine dehydrogenase